MTKLNITKLKWVKFAVIMPVGLLFLLTSIIAYSDIPQFMNQLTFLGNFFAGIVFIAYGIFTLFRSSKIMEIFYLMATAVLLVVIAVCIIYAGSMNFRGLFLFLHIVNPVIAFLLFLFTADMPKTKWHYVPLAAAPCVIYFIYCIIYGSLSGDYLYFFLDANEMGWGRVFMFAILVLLFIVLISFILYFINRILIKRIKSRGKSILKQ